jgi:hypothetical protein
MQDQAGTEQPRAQLPGFLQIFAFQSNAKAGPSRNSNRKTYHDDHAEAAA